MSYLNEGRLGLIGAPTYPMLRDATQATLFEILDSARIPYEHNKGENTLKFKYTGSRIIFRPLDEFERLRGTNLAWFGLDELTYTMEDAWLRLEGRLRDPKATRLSGFAVWTPKGFDWVYRKFIADPVPDYDAIIAPASENRYLLEKNPDFYDHLKSSYDEKFYRQEVLGEYVNMSGGLVYSSFSRPDHVSEVKLDPNAPLHWTLDFNVDPMSSLIVQVLDGYVWVVDEIVLRNSNTKAACDEFVKRYPRHAGEIRIYGDASGNHQQSTGSSDYDIIKEHLKFNGTYAGKISLHVPPANPAVRERINLTNCMLRSMSGEIRVAIDPKCKELIQDFEQVSYKEDTGQIDKDRDRHRTHTSDAFGYLLWQECRPRPRVGERGERLLPC